MYCSHVPKMDPSRALEAKLEPTAWDTTNQVLGSMRRKWKLVNGMSRNLATVAFIYTTRLKEWRKVSDSYGAWTDTPKNSKEFIADFGSFEHD